MKFKTVLTVVVLLSSTCSVHYSNADSVGVVRMEEGEDSNQLSVPLTADELFSLRKAAASVKPEKENATTNSPDSHKFVRDSWKRTEVDVVVDLQTMVSTTGPRFVGLTLDASVFRRVWRTFNVQSKALHSLAKGLAPSFLRVGGTAADFFIFSPNGTTDDPAVTDDYDYDYDYSDLNPLTVDIKNYTVTGADWKRLNYLVQVAGWDLIFDFNEFLRQDGVWDTDNARELLTFSQQNNYPISGFQLGNEPNSYYHNFGFTIPASQLADDMKKLRSVLSQFPSYQNSSIFGPDVTKVTKGSGRKYFQEFLQTGGQTVVSAATLHHYYFNVKERGASVKDFVNTTILDTLKQELSIGTSMAHSLAPDLPVWLSETSSVSGGGLPGVSDAYVAGFMWLDKLGLSALYGLQAVLRQSLYNGDYPLIAKHFTPNPDYFLTLLYKRLVQGPIFNVMSSTDSVRMYASCANPSLYNKGALTVYVLNVQDKATTLNFTQFTDQSYDLYILTPGDGHGLKSAFVALNGQKLVLVDQELPPLPPLQHSGPVTFPSYSFGFVVIPHAEVDLCFK